MVWEEFLSTTAFSVWCSAVSDTYIIKNHLTLPQQRSQVKLWIWRSTRRLWLWLKNQHTLSALKYLSILRLSSSSEADSVTGVSSSSSSLQRNHKQQPCTETPERTTPEWPSSSSSSVHREQTHTWMSDWYSLRNIHSWTVWDLNSLFTSYTKLLLKKKKILSIIYTECDCSVIN